MFNAIRFGGGERTHVPHGGIGVCVHVSLGNSICLLTRLLKHITGQKEQPNVQQQQMHPQKSHLMLFRNVKKC